MFQSPDKPVIGLELVGCIEIVTGETELVDLQPEKWVQNLKRTMQSGFFNSHIPVDPDQHGTIEQRHRDGGDGGGVEGERDYSNVPWRDRALQRE